VHGFVLEAKQSGRLRTQDPVATARGSVTMRISGTRARALTFDYTTR